MSRLNDTASAPSASPGAAPRTVRDLCGGQAGVDGDEESHPGYAALTGAHSFASGMAELDEAMLLLFSDRVAAQTAWSDDPDELLSGLEGVEARAVSETFAALAGGRRWQDRRSA